MIDNSKEYILCAALKYKDSIICGRRHHNCYELLKQLLNLTDAELPGKECCGFMTSWNRFVDRKEALVLAIVCNQAKKFAPDEDLNAWLKLKGNEDAILSSEELYYVNCEGEN